MDDSRRQDMNSAAEISIQPYRGIVKVTFSDAVIASTEYALTLTELGTAPVFYIPFKDIYFEFLKRSEIPARDTPRGTEICWGASAAGEAADDVMWTYEEPAAGYEKLLAHGAFSPYKVLIEATALPDEARRA
jgi:uncharacterized protein (DUF427 family)